MRALLLPPLLLAGLSGCGQSATNASGSLMPADAALAANYQRHCLGCHSAALSGAPQTGDTAAWARRLAKGMERVVERTREGVGIMPPSGNCVKCTDAELEALIRFMAGRN